MCVATITTSKRQETSSSKASDPKERIMGTPPVANVATTPEPPTLLARLTCVGALLGIFAVWGKLTFVGETQTPGSFAPMQDFRIPLAFSVGYLVSLPLLRQWCEKSVLWKTTDMKLLLKESMFVYNLGQVLLNGWMVYKLIVALTYRGHPFIGDTQTITSGAPYAVWVHYCDKYLEFLDTYFMILRGNFKQVSFLHKYHHFTIVWAWYVAIAGFPGGDNYFGALCNSFIHVLMYSYYALRVYKIPCPWKMYLTAAQLVQFVTVLVYTFRSYMLLTPEAGWQIKGGYLVQTFEMVSLYVLFSGFFKDAYTDRQPKKSLDVLKQQKQAVTDMPPDSVEEQSSASSDSSTDEGVDMASSS